MVSFFLQGDEAQTFFLVEKGEVKIMMTQVSTQVPWESVS